MTKCPKCDKVMLSVKINNIDARATQMTWKAIAYTCPHCSSLLSVSIDPVAIKADIINSIVAELRKKA